MMKRISILSVCLLALTNAPAQDIYKLQQFSDYDLAGTARYVGMGGAMGALGADLSVMRTNPAGIGLYRSNDFTTTVSLLSQNEGERFAGRGTSRLSFDNVGLVYSFNNQGSENLQFLNVGFGYHKRNNFNTLIAADVANPNGKSQTWQMSDLSAYWLDEQGPTINENYATMLSKMGWETYLYEYDQPTNKYYFYDAANNSYRKAAWGSVKEYDFNLSFNVNDRWYVGMTVGAYDVNQQSSSRYHENLMLQDRTPVGSYELVNERSLTGDGFDLKLGVITRPIEYSTFRMGISIATPTYYSLRSSTNTYISSNIAGYTPARYGFEPYQTAVHYNLRTPWRFGLSLGEVIGNFLAVGLDYEYADYSSATITYGDGSYYENFYENKDDGIAREANKYLNDVHTLRLGAEARVSPAVSLRAGYNYVSSPIKKDAYFNQYTTSQAGLYATSSNYMNLSETNRFTLGAGYREKSFYADFALQFQKQTGDFYAFSTQADHAGYVQELQPTKVNLNKTQAILTLGYKF